MSGRSTTGASQATGKKAAAPTGGSGSGTSSSSRSVSKQKATGNAQRDLMPELTNAPGGVKARNNSRAAAGVNAERTAAENSDDEEEAQHGDADGDLVASPTDADGQLGAIEEHADEEDDASAASVTMTKADLRAMLRDAAKEALAEASMAAAANAREAAGAGAENGDEPCTPRQAGHQTRGGGAAATKERQDTSSGPSPVQSRLDTRGLNIDRLLYAEASRGTTLEDWIFSVEQQCRLRGIRTADGDHMKIGSAFWDRAMEQWWSGQVVLRASEGTPIDSWQDLTAELRSTFVATGEAEQAFDELLSMRQTAEKMDAYMQRAAALRARAGQRADGQDRAIVAALIRGADESRFPFALHGIRKAVRVAERANRPLCLTAVRTQLMELAHDEPRIRTAPAAAPAARGGNVGRGGSGGAPQSTRVAALQQQLADAIREEGGSEADVRIAALGGEGLRPCGKCGKTGHRVFECTSKTDRRTCFSCSEKGHVATNCPKQQKAAGDGSASAAGSASKSKNE